MFDHRFKIWLAALLLILVLVAMPMPEYDGDVETTYDKVAHFVMFGGFSLLSAWWLKTATHLGRHPRLVLSASIGTIYAGLGEFIQIYAPGRTVSELDFLAGLAGALSALLLLYAFDRQKA